MGNILLTVIINGIVLLITETSCETLKVYGLVNEGDNQGNVTSRGYPRCCDGTAVNITYVFTQTMPAELWGFVFYFYDLDLPSSAKIEIREGDLLMGKTPMDVPIFYNRERGWNRPFILAKKQETIITVRSPSTEPRDGLFVGFKLHYQYKAVSDLLPIMRSHHTSGCGGTLNALESGEVLVKPQTFPIGYQRYCVWQLKLPPGGGISHQLVAFLRITHFYINGSLQIRRGISSDSPVIAQLESQGRFLSELEAQPEAGFTSTEGFYISLHINPTGSRFGFVFGDFHFSPEIDSSHKSCILVYEGAEPGFYCTSSKWCIARSFMCDGIQHCSQNEDEQYPDCSRTTIKTTRTTRTVIPTKTTLVTTTLSPYHFFTTFLPNITDNFYNMNASSTNRPFKFYLSGCLVLLIVLALYLLYRYKQRRNNGVNMRNFFGRVSNTLCRNRRPYHHEALPVPTTPLPDPPAYYDVGAPITTPSSGDLPPSYNEVMAAENSANQNLHNRNLMSHNNYQNANILNYVNNMNGNTTCTSIV